MTSLIRSIAGRQPRRADPTLTLNDLASMVYQGLEYGFVNSGTLTGNEEKIDPSFAGYAQGAYKRNGIIFACEQVRLRVFAQARFQFRQMRGGRPGDLFGTADLAKLERPDGPDSSTTTGDLLHRMLLDADIAGSWYGRDRGDRIQRLEPHWVTIILGSRSGRPDDVEKLGYVYQPGGAGSGEKAVPLLVGEVAHFAPTQDPEARFRGMSWLTPIIREIQADNSATTHKQKFFDQGATPNLVVTLGDATLNPQTFREWVDRFEGDHSGAWNAYRTMYLAQGADAKVIGTDMRQMDFKATQGAGETRIAAAAGVHPSIVGLSEGLQGSSLNAGNFTAARRLLSDVTLADLWRNAAGSLATIVNVPTGADLWYDARDIPFLKDDQKDAAEIQQLEAEAIRKLVDGGFTWDSVIASVNAKDWSQLKHTGLYSVQLQPAGASALVSPNGNGQPQLPSPSN